MVETIAAIIGMVGSIVAAWLSQRRSAVARIGNKSDPVVRMFVIVNTGLVLTVIALIVVLSLGQLWNIRQETTQTKEAVRIQSKRLAKFAESRADIEDPAKQMHLDARAVLDGAGPKEVRTSERIWKAEDVVYVRENEWVELVLPEGSTDRDMCIIERFGRLKIIGFSEKRRAALVEYMVPPDAPKPAGTECRNRTLFFYPI